LEIPALSALSAKPSRYLNGVYKLKGNPWGNFEWLAEETERYLKLEEGQVEYTEPTASGSAGT
jgi:hypothetical protein